MTGPTVLTQKLVLHPAQPGFGAIDRTQMLQGLQAIGLLGGTFSFRGSEAFLAGTELARLISFLGCAPHFLTDAADQDKAGFYHLEVIGPVAEMRFIASRLTRPPGCPDCRRRIPDWQELIDQWRGNPSDSAWTCPDCGAISRPHELNWRQNAGFGRLFVEVHGVFPGEAVPSDQLMAQLRDLSGTPWRHFYFQE